MRMLAIRLREGDDLKQAVEALVRDRRLSSATIVSAVGSVSRATLRMAGAQPDAQDIRDYNEAFEIVSLIGNAGPGRIHLHASLSRADGTVIGGHVKEGCIVHTTVELVVATDDAITFSEQKDPTTGFGELAIS